MAAGSPAGLGLCGEEADAGLVARRLAVCHSVLCASHRCITHSTGFAPEYRLPLKDELTTVEAQCILTANETSIVRAAALALFARRG